MPATADDNTLSFVSTLLSSRFEVDPAQITPEASLADLGLDSLAAVELLDVLQEHTEVPFDEEQTGLGSTVAEIVAHIDDRLVATDPA